MTRAELDKAVEAILGEVPMDAVPTAAYCTAVRDLLRARYMEKLTDQVYSMEVYHRNDQLLINIWLAVVDRDNKIRGNWVKHAFTYPLS